MPEDKKVKLVALKIGKYATLCGQTFVPKELEIERRSFKHGRT